MIENDTRPGGLLPETPPPGISLIDQIEHRRTALRVAELAGLLSMSKRSIYDMIDDGRLPAYKIGNAIRLDPKITADVLRKRLTVTIQ